MSTWSTTTGNIRWRCACNPRPAVCWRRERAGWRNEEVRHPSFGARHPKTQPEQIRRRREVVARLLPNPASCSIPVRPSRSSGPTSVPTSTNTRSVFRSCPPTARQLSSVLERAWRRVSQTGKPEARLVSVCTACFLAPPRPSVSAATQSGSCRTVPRAYGEQQRARPGTHRPQAHSPPAVRQRFSCRSRSCRVPEPPRRRNTPHRPLVRTSIETN